MSGKSIIPAPGTALSQRASINPLRPVCRRLAPRADLQRSRRPLSTAGRRHSYEPSSQYQEQPRWSHTPERMRAPVSLKKHDPENEYQVNESQERLDEFYAEMLGEGGDRLLTDEIKWLAVTHKSFDQGRRGYNDRLAFLGKRIINLQTSLGLLHRKDGTFADPPDRQHIRQPFRHPVVDLLPRLTEEARLQIANSRRLASLGMRMHILDVVRWKPNKAQDLGASGYEQVVSQAVYAIVGAIALQRGGEVVNRVVKDRILAPLGLT